jgi:hypothetical protein
MQIDLFDIFVSSSDSFMYIAIFLTEYGGGGQLTAAKLGSHAVVTGSERLQK